MGLRPYGAPDDIAALQPQGTNAPLGAVSVLKDAVTTRNFWILFVTFFICGASTNGLIGTHLIPACIDHGFSALVYQHFRQKASHSDRETLVSEVVKEL
jgi:hypothetical protein